MFSVHTRIYGSVRWNETDGFTGSPFLVERINRLIESGEAVPTICSGAFPKAADKPEWVAWYTAKAALEGNAVEGVWSPAPKEVFSLFQTPEGSVA